MRLRAAAGRRLRRRGRVALLALLLLAAPVVRPAHLRSRAASHVREATIPPVAETTLTIEEQLKELGARLDWVREYL